MSAAAADSSLALVTPVNFKNMKQLFRKTLFGAALIGCCSLPAQAQTTANKVGIIDLRKVFDGYYKTKQADVNLKDEAGDLEKQRKEMVDTFKKGEDEWKKLLDKSNDQAVSAAERDKSKQAAEKKLLELRGMEQTVKEFEASARAKLGEKQRRKRDAILHEIRETINTKSKSAGFTMVIDTAAESINNTPVVLFSNGENDLTESVLSQLNAAAPAPVAGEKKPATEKKDEKKK